jgi:transposase InsO family protein
MIRLKSQGMGAEHVLDYENYTEYVLALHQKQVLEEQTMKEQIRAITIFEENSEENEATTNQQTQRITADQIQYQQTARPDITAIKLQLIKQQPPIDLTLIKIQDINEWDNCFNSIDDFKQFFMAYHRNEQQFQPTEYYKLPTQYNKTLESIQQTQQGYDQNIPQQTIYKPRTPITPTKQQTQTENENTPYKTPKKGLDCSGHKVDVNDRQKQQPQSKKNKTPKFVKKMLNCHRSRQEWDNKQQQVRKLIRETTTWRIVQEVIDKMTNCSVKNLLMALEEKYGEMSPGGLIYLDEQLSRCQQGARENLRDYFARFNRIRQLNEEVDNKITEKVFRTKVLSGIDENRHKEVRLILAGRQDYYTMNLHEFFKTQDSLTPNNNYNPYNQKDWTQNQQNNTGYPYNKDNNQNNNTNNCVKCGYTNHRTEDCIAQQWKIDNYKNRRDNNHQNNTNKQQALQVEDVTEEYGEKNSKNQNAGCVTHHTLNVDKKKTTKNNKFFGDTGATIHVCHNNQLLTNIRPTETILKGPLNEKIQTTEVGDIELENEITLKDCVIAESAIKNLVSIGKLAEAGIKFTIIKETINGYNEENWEKLMNGKKPNPIIVFQKDESNLYALKMREEKNQLSEKKKTESICYLEKGTMMHFHRKFGHACKEKIIELEKQDPDHIRIIGERDIECETCLRQKMTASPYAKKKKWNAKEVGDVLHMDIGFIPKEIKTIGGYTCYLIIKDHFTKFTWLYPMNTKDEAFRFFKKTRANINTQHQSKTKLIVSDNGGEFISKEMERYLEKKGILHHPIPAHSEPCNGNAERMNREVKDKGRCMIDEAKLPKSFIALAYEYATDIYNILPTKVNDNNTAPYVKLNNNTPYLKMYKEFGARCHYLEKKPKNKTEQRGYPAIFVGVTPNGFYKLWDIEKQEIRISRDVQFKKKKVATEIEEEEPKGIEIKELVNQHQLEDDARRDDDYVEEEEVTGPFLQIRREILEKLHPSEKKEEKPKTRESERIKKNKEIGENELIIGKRIKIYWPGEGRYYEGRVKRMCTPEEAKMGGTHVIKYDDEKHSIIEDLKKEKFKIVDEKLLELSKEYRKKKKVEKEKEVEEKRKIRKQKKESESVQQSTKPIGGNDDSMKKQKTKKERKEKHEESIEEMLFNIGEEINEREDPKTIKEAMESPEWPNWQIALDKELESQKKMTTWHLEEPKDKTGILPTLFTFKKKSDGTFKARICAKGFKQIEGLNYRRDNTFAPTLKNTTLRTLIAIALQQNLKIHNMDVVTAFLHAPLKEEIFVRLPIGYGPEAGKIAKLDRAIYGLKQASAEFHDLMTKKLEEKGYQKLVSDQCVFVKKNEEDKIKSIIAIFVDDCILIGKEQEIEEMKKDLQDSFIMKDLGELKEIIGIQVERTASRITLNQPRYIEKALKRFGMENCYPAYSPLPEKAYSSKYKPTNNEPFDNINLYQQLVGTINYITNTVRPDLAFTVNALSRKMLAPVQEDWLNAQQTLRYLKQTKNLGLNYYKYKPAEIIGYADASYAETEDGKSVGGYLFTYLGGAISWSSKKQKLITLSSMEAEYLQLSEAAKEAKFLRNLLKELQQKVNQPIKLFEDNQSAIVTAKTTISTDRNKHFSVRSHYIRDQIKRQKINLIYLPGTEQPADMLTKALGKQLIVRHRAAVGLEEESTRRDPELRGNVGVSSWIADDYPTNV